MTMMDCKQFREVLDCFVDHELSPDGMAAADGHLRECVRCQRTTARLLELRRHMREVVTAAVPSPALEQRVRASFRPTWTSASRSSTLRLAVAATILVGIAMWIGIANRAKVDDALAVAMDRVIVRLAGPSSVIVEGTVLCRDCELERRYGVKAMCRQIGHHGAIATAGGRIWNIVEQPSSSVLIHDGTLLGKRVRVRARLFRPAGAMVVDSYTIGADARDRKVTHEYSANPRAEFSSPPWKLASVQPSFLRLKLSDRDGDTAQHQLNSRVP